MAAKWTVVKKALTMNSEWEDKDELLDVIYWGRQLLALLIGLCWGVFPFTGCIALAAYMGISTVVGCLYLTYFQDQDPDRFGGITELAKEGFGSAFATFMISWIIVYNFVHVL